MISRIRQTILEMQVDVVDHKTVARKIQSWASTGESRYICVSNVHMCMEAYDNLDFRQIVNDADLVVPDGRPLVWAQHLLGHRNASQVRGADLVLSLCSMASSQDIPVGLYGGTPEALHGIVTFLQDRFPLLRIVYASSPPFYTLSSAEECRYVKDIIDSGVRILFVGLGCPKQETWMAAHRGILPCVMVGVGAVFDFLGGTKRHAPGWIQWLGLEWSFRLACEPRRLWKRYLKHNPRFIYFFTLQFFRHLLKKREQ